MSSIFIGYIWTIDKDWIGVVPGDDSSIVWREWLYRQPATMRLYVDDGYWKISSSLKALVKQRFIVAGWMLDTKKPEFRQKKTNGVLSKDTPVQRYYDTLFLAENAPKAVVDASYRALAKENHPDRCEEGEQKTKELNVSRDGIYKHRGW